MRQGSIHAIHTSAGGVPKRARSSARVTANGLDGDRQRHLRYHGGPDRAVCVYSLELIRALQAEGHPIEPGSIGENVTFSGVDWTSIEPGTRIDIGTVRLEVTKPALPCKNIADAFRDRDFARISERVRPGWSRFYCRVLVEGVVAVGDAVTVVPGGGDQ
jgi:MOSC domain-containing protein YiiM